MYKLLFLTALFLCGSITAQTVGDVSLTRVGESCPNTNVVLLSGQEQLSGQAFQQDALLSHNGYQYTVYYNATRNVCIARRKLPLGQWHEVVLPHKNTADDSHNVISMGICATDGTIHLAYDHHNTTLQYCRSIVGLASDPEHTKWTADNFTPTTSQLISQVTVPDVTYPRFISKPDGNLLFECRYKLSGDGDSYLREYNGTTHQWSLLGRYVQGMDANPNACAYINRMDYDILGRLHVSWCWRDDYNGMSNHDIFYAYSEDHGRTWKNTGGQQVAVTEVINPTDSRASGLCLREGIASLQVATIPYNRGYINQESQTSDQQGRVHILNSYIPDGAGTDANWESSRLKARLHHRFRDASGVWHVNQVKKQGAAVHSYCRSQVIADAFDNAWVIANGAEIYAATSAANYADWQLVSDTDKNRFCSEPQVDHPRLLNDGVLSFVYVGRDKKVVVIDYLTDNPKQPSGTGLREDTQNLEWSGTLETRYGEAYTLYLETDVPLEVYVDGALLLTKTASGRQEISAAIPLIASHRHALVIKAAANPSVWELKWSSERTTKASVPVTSLYPEPVRQDDEDNPYPYSPDLQKKAELPVSLSGEKLIDAASGTDYLTLPIDPAGDYSVEVHAEILSAEGRGLDIDARAGNGRSFCYSINSGEGIWRFAVQGEKVHCYHDGQYLAVNDLDDWTGSIDAVNVAADWSGTAGNNSDAPTAYGWNSTVSVPWNTANGGSGVRYMDVTSGHIADGNAYSGRLMTVRWDAIALYGAYYYLPVTLEANTSYRFSFLYEWWSNAQGNITAAVSTTPAASGIIALKSGSPAVLNVLYEGDLTFKTGNAGVYYLLFTGGNGLMGGIGALSLNKITDTPRLIVGKNYIGGAANILIHSVTYDEDGAFAPTEKEQTNENIVVQSQNAVRVFSRDNILYINNLPEQLLSIRIYDLLGKSFYRQQIKQNTFSIALPSGVYLLVLQSGYKEIYKGKVIV
ncbi:MAG: hypothetical protein EZS26_000943 [Candidatus Ordinivivax streblomastigis]|uniref:T9SS C-terminal target domain-containing protein n=1 Tax=Candidatus Ordinivivax streblomastigis TaxID=2540710 RepID=A0A5M8P2U4_9BACT|nr:MAG: hypothetical protein EZS26_000943 [Candidatus Ordinivivax streblomastigis]